jgi:DNA-binding CsgD family transcriptional regulator
MTLNSGHLQSGMGVLAKTDRASAQYACEEALKISREIGWRSGEAYALIILGNFWGIRGNYTQSFNLLKSSLAIAEEIQHSQWIVYSQYCLGVLYLDTLDLSQAREHLEYALAGANQIGSRWWVTNITGFLAQTYILQKDDQHAAAALDVALEITTKSFLRKKEEVSALTMGQRICWSAVAQLALSRNDPKSALRIVDDLIATSANLSDAEIISPLWYLRAEALIALSRLGLAEEALLSAKKSAEDENEKPLLWRIKASLGKLYQLQSRTEEATRVFSGAQGIIEEIAGTIPEIDQREKFAKHALAYLPKSRQLTPRQSAKREYGGLTAREREVAAMIAGGKSNREIAESLVISERTIETHVENVLARLGFSSRTQIATWAVEKGLSTQKES